MCSFYCCWLLVGCWCPREDRIGKDSLPRGRSHSDAVITARRKMNPNVSAIRISVSFFIGISVEHFFDEAISLGFGLWRACHAVVEKQVELLSCWRNLAPAWRVCRGIHGYYRIAVRIADKTTSIAKTARPPSA